MISKAKEFLPVLIDLSDGSSGWGRLLEIHPTGAKLLTRCRLARGNVICMSFEIDGLKMEGIRAGVSQCGKDEDGYLVLKLAFLDDSQVAGIRARLLDMFNRDQ